MIKYVHNNIKNREFVNNNNDTTKSIINVLQHVKFYFYFIKKKMFKKMFIN